VILKSHGSAREANRVIEQNFLLTGDVGLRHHRGRVRIAPRGVCGGVERAGGSRSAVSTRGRWRRCWRSRCRQGTRVRPAAAQRSASHCRQKAICCWVFTPAQPDSPAASLRIFSSALIELSAHPVVRVRPASEPAIEQGKHRRHEREHAANRYWRFESISLRHRVAISGAYPLNTQNYPPCGTSLGCATGHE
jgi:hypothetical protein